MRVRCGRGVKRRRYVATVVELLAGGTCGAPLPGGFNRDESSSCFICSFPRTNCARTGL
jgi:hypothetical protein